MIGMMLNVALHWILSVEVFNVCVSLISVMIISVCLFLLLLHLTEEYTLEPTGMPTNSPTINTQCQDIYDGEWVLVRHSYDQWHLATDNLAGNSGGIYGTFDNDPMSTNTWGIGYDSVLEGDGSDVFMFSNGDCSKYLIATNDQWSTNYENEDKYIIASHVDTDYYAKWYNRAANPEDPWISYRDHLVDSSSVLYGENGWTGTNGYTGFHNVWLS